MRFRIVVEVEAERVQGKFAPKEDVAEQIVEAIESADPGTISGVGADSDSEYEVVSWEVTEEEPPARPRRRRPARDTGDGPEDLKELLRL